MLILLVNGIGEISHPYPSQTLEPIWMPFQQGIQRVKACTRWHFAFAAQLSSCASIANMRSAVVIATQELIRRWDSEREHFYDRIVQYFKI